MIGNSAKLRIEVDFDGQGAIRGVRQLGGEFDKTGKTGVDSIKKTDQALGGLNHGLEAGKKLVLGLGGSFGAWKLKEVAVDIAQVGGAFQQDMATVGGIARATTEEFAAMKAEAREMGENTEWSASQAAGGLKYLSMAGLDAGKSVAALPPMLDLATAGHIDLARAADISTNALTAMRLPVDQLNRVNDTFIGTITTSNTNMEMLAESFKYAAPVAAAYGMEIEDLSGLIGLLGNAGIQGSMAGTQLAMAYSDVHKVFEKYGESTKRADGSTKDLIDAVKLLEARGASAGEVMEIFGERSGRGMLALLGTGGKAIDEYLAKIHNSEGATTALATRMRDTFEQDIKSYNSALESLKIDIFEEFEASARTSLQDLTQWIRDNKGEIVGFLADVGDEASQSARAIKPLVSGLFELTGVAAKITEITPGGSTAVGAGIVGRLLFGSWGAGAALATMEVLNKSFEELHQQQGWEMPSWNQMGRDVEGLTGIFQQLAEVAGGMRDWNTGDLLTIQAEPDMAAYDAQVNAAIAARQAQAEAAKESDTWLRQQANATKTMAEEDKTALEKRLKEYQKFYGELEKLIKEQAEQEKRHVQELNDLYRQKLDLQKSTADLVRELRESQMTPEDKYASQQAALKAELEQAMAMTGQDQIKALDEYKREVAAFAKTWQEGIGTVSGSDIVDQAIADIQRAGDTQIQAIEALTQAKQEQIELDRVWGKELAASALESAGKIDDLKATISELDEQIKAMDKEIAIEGKDLVTGTVQAIQEAIDKLHDQTITLTVNTVRHTLYVQPDGTIADDQEDGGYRVPDYSAPELKIPVLDSFARGTDWVPKTGVYQLHEGEGVLTAAENAGRSSSSGGAGGGMVIQGGVQIVLPSDAVYQARTDEDWRRLTRDVIAPELLAMGGRYAS